MYPIRTKQLNNSIIGPIMEAIMFPIMLDITTAVIRCLIINGEPKNYVFERSGTIVTPSSTFGPNVVVTSGSTMVHHGAVSSVIPAYDISPLVRPTFPDVYDTCESEPNPDKHGLNWERTDQKNAWVFDLLGGKVDGPELILNGTFDTNVDHWTSFQPTDLVEWDNGTMMFTSVTSARGVYQNVITSPTDRLEVRAQSVVASIPHLVRLTVGSIPGAGYAQSLERSAPHEFVLRAPAASSGTLTNIYLRSSLAGSINWDSISAKTISQATGTLGFKMQITPTKTEWETVGDLNIISGDAGNQIVYVEDGTGLYCATDGVNTCKSTVEYTPGSEDFVALLFSANGRMRLDVNGNMGVSTAFIGTFSPGETIKWGLLNKDIMLIDTVCGNPGLALLPAVVVTEDSVLVYQDGELVVIR